MQKDEEVGDEWDEFDGNVFMKGKRKRQAVARKAKGGAFPDIEARALRIKRHR